MKFAPLVLVLCMLFFTVISASTLSSCSGFGQDKVNFLQQLEGDIIEVLCPGP